MLKQKISATRSHISSYRAHYLWLAVFCCTSALVLGYVTLHNPGRAKADTPVTITSPTDGAVLASASPTITGTGPANTKIFVRIDDDYLGSTTSDGSGDWSFIVSQETLTNDTHQVSASVEDARALVTCGGGGDCGATNSFSSYDMATGDRQANVPIPVTGADLGPIGVAADAAHHTAYVASNTPGEIEVIDTNSEAIAHTIPVSSCDCQSLTKPVLNAAATKLFVAVNDPGDHHIAVIDTGSDTVTTEIAWPGGSSQSTVAIATNPDQTKAYISSTNGKVYVLDLATNSFVGTISLSESVGLTSLSVSQDGTRLYGVAGTDEIYVADLNSNTALPSLTLPSENAGQLNSIIVNSANNEAYISRYFDTIITVDLTSGNITGQVANTEDAGVLSADAAFDRLYAANSLSIIDAQDNLLIAQQNSSIGQFASLDMAIENSTTSTSQSVGFSVAVTTNPPSSVHITSPINGRTLAAGDRTITGTVNPPNSTVLLSFDNAPEIPVPDDGNGNWSYQTSFSDSGSHTIKAHLHINSGQDIYVANLQAASVSIVDTVSNTIVGSVSTAPFEPISVTVNHAGTKAYITELIPDFPNFTPRIEELDLATHALTRVISFDSGAVFSTAINPAGTMLYLSFLQQSSNDYQILAIDLSDNNVVATYNGTSTGTSPLYQFSLSPDGSKIYVNGSGPVDGDPTQQSILKTVDATSLTEANDLVIPVSEFGSLDVNNVIISQDGQTAYLTTGSDHKIVKVNLNNNAVSIINVSQSFSDLYVNADQTKLYAYGDDSDIMVYNLTNNTSVELPTSQPNSANSAVDSNADGSKLYFPPASSSSTFPILDVAHQTVSSSPDFGQALSVIGNNFFGTTPDEDHTDQVSINIIPRSAPGQTITSGATASDQSASGSAEPAATTPVAPAAPTAIAAPPAASPSTNRAIVAISKVLDALADIATRLTPVGNPAIIPIGIILLVAWLVFWLASLVAIERRRTHKFKELGQTLGRRLAQLQQISNLLMHYLNTPLAILRASIETAMAANTIPNGPALNVTLSALSSDVETYLNQIKSAVGPTSPEITPDKASLSSSLRQPLVWLVIVGSGSLIASYIELVHRSGQLHISAFVVLAAVVGWLSVSCGMVFAYNSLVTSRGQKIFASQAVELSRHSVALQVSLVNSAAVKIDQDRSELERLLGGQAAQPHIKAGLTELEQTFDRLQQASTYAQNNATVEDQEKMDRLMKQLADSDETLRQAGAVVSPPA